MTQAEWLQFAVIAENEVVDGQSEGGARTLSGVVNVTVRVLDINDQRPVIDVPALNNNAANNGSDTAVTGVDVCVRACQGDRLLHVVATDRDSGPNARLHFSLLDVENSPSTSTSYFSVNAEDGWIAARRDLSDLEDGGVGREFVVMVVVTDAGRPPLSTNRTLLLTLSEDACRTSVVATAGGQVRRGIGRFTAAVLSTATVLTLLVVLTVILLILTWRRRRCRRLEKRDTRTAAGASGVERRWTEADGAEELTAKQRLNSCEKTSSAMCLRHPTNDVDDAGVCERSCFNVQRQFEVVWQASSPGHLRQVCTVYACVLYLALYTA